MTCFWDGLLASLKFAHNKQMETISNRIDLIKYFKNIVSDPSNELVSDFDNIIVNNEKLSKQQINETIDAIKTFNIDSIYLGYYCSTCDPFMILFVVLTQCTIQHKYMNNIIVYKSDKSNGTLCFESNSSHFWFQSHA